MSDVLAVFARFGMVSVVAAVAGVVTGRCAVRLIRHFAPMRIDSPSRFGRVSDERHATMLRTGK